MRSENAGSMRLNASARGSLCRAGLAVAVVSSIAACAPPHQRPVLEPSAPTASSAPSTPSAESAPSAPSAFSEVGLASWYDRRRVGYRTANGERFSPGAMTAAHRTLAFGSVVRVTNLANGREVDVKINDRGPQDRRRIIDLSKGAADALGFTALGVTRVRIEQVLPSLLQSSAP